MALNTQFSDTLVNAMANSFITTFAGAYIHIYTGNFSGAQVDGSRLIGNGGIPLAVFTLPSPAFASPVSGVIIANAIASVVATGTGSPTCVRFVKANYSINTNVQGGTASTDILMDCTAGASDANLIISPITSGTNVSIGSFTHEVTNATAGQ